MMHLVLLRDFHVRRNRFRHPQETYAGWGMLCASDGAFRFAVDGADAGEARFGDVVVVAPGMTLARQVLTASLTFHFWEWQLPDGESAAWLPSPGKTTIRADDRERFAGTLAAFVQNEAFAWREHLLRDLLFLCHRTRQDVGDALMAQAANRLRERGADRGFDTATLAGVLNLSPAVLTRRFAEAHGCTPAAFLAAWRLRQAQTLLLATDDTVDAVAQACGYRDGFYLCRVFRQNLRTTPSEYRRKNRV